MTKRYKIAKNVLKLISILLNAAPILVYVIIAFASSNLVHEKVTLSMTVVVAIILTLVTAVNKVQLRSRLWIILIGIYVCLKEIMTPILLTALCQVLDELVVSPLHASYKQKYIIHREIDKR